jgi:hypothetical protein
MAIVTPGVEFFSGVFPSYWRAQPCNLNFGCTALFTILNAKSSVWYRFPSFLRTGHFGQQMKHYLHSNDPLFDPATLGYLLHRGAIRERNKRLRWQGIKSLVQRIRTGKSHFV